MGCRHRLLAFSLKAGGTPAYLSTDETKGVPIVINTNMFGVSMPAGTARDLPVFNVAPVQAAHTAAAWAAAAGAALQRKRRTAAATDASVDRGIV